ncbi:YusW family protein [Sporosarcina sp. E16_3]|uniref:YusW family protein n=1 Tax=Sporosarcina sp. E16_3 TaxID=2789293 RepID=UPI001A910B74|nr:YusW family protein [Sporosarcina sp. E16_3]MBO0601269.1 YusW family protein [Sporosarcina sp. E16_3]
MIKLKLFGLVILATALIIGGCGKKVHNTDTAYGFTKFELKIDVSGEEDVKAEYKMKTNKIEAEYINKAHKIKLKGDPAMDELNKIFTEIELTKDQSQQDVIDKVLKAVDVDNFSKFKLEIEYDDGTKLEFEEKL